MIIDLSHRIAPGMPIYPGMPELHLRNVLAHDDPSGQSRYAPGTTFQIAAYELGGNTGTYVDAPFHRHAGGPDLADLALERLVDLPGVVVIALHEGPIQADALSGVDLAGKAVLVRTDWSDRWGSAEYFRSGPFLTADACRALVRAQAALVGIDCANIDDMADMARPAHTILLAAGIPIVEHLRGLDELPPGGFRFSAVPPAIVGGTSFPVRALAIV